MRREGIIAVEAVDAPFGAPADADEAEILTDREVDPPLVAVGHDHRARAVAAGDVVETPGTPGDLLHALEADQLEAGIPEPDFLARIAKVMSWSTDGSQAGRKRRRRARRAAPPA